MKSALRSINRSHCPEDPQRLIEEKFSGTRDDKNDTFEQRLSRYLSSRVLIIHPMLSLTCATFAACPRNDDDDDDTILRKGLPDLVSPAGRRREAMASLEQQAKRRAQVHFNDSGQTMPSKAGVGCELSNWNRCCKQSPVNAGYRLSRKQYAPGKRPHPTRFDAS